MTKLKSEANGNVDEECYMEKFVKSHQVIRYLFLAGLGHLEETTVARAAIFAHCMHCNLHSAVHSTLWLPCGALAVH